MRTPATSKENRQSQDTLIMGSTKKKKKKKKSMALLTSSSRREASTLSVTDNGTCGGGSSKSIGCMAGIFHLFSRHHHNNSRKRLPASAERKKKNVDPRKPLQPEQRRHSCEVQRSPTLPPELRRSSSAELALDSPRRLSPLVVRLMGLDEVPVSSPASAAEKRRKLLGALEKCDEDLKSLKRIIDAVRVVAAGDSKREDESTVNSVDCVGEQPSPVSVLEAAVSSPPTSPAERSKNGDLNKSNLNNNKGSHSIFKRASIERPREVGLLEEFGQAKRLTEGGGRRRRRRWRLESKRSHALVESVGEVWEDGVWEQRWEVGRVGVGVERGILSDLVDEFVREMLGLDFKDCCRKRLCF